MRDKQSAYRGCLLGLAVGDAMGYTVDDRSWDQIREDYGPNGLLGYDLVNGYADVTSHTQLAAFACNGVLLGITRGQLQGAMAPFVKYIYLAQREWAQTQRYRANPGRTFCWLAQTRQMCTRRCMDTGMLDAIQRGKPGSVEEGINKSQNAGALLMAVAVGLFSDGERARQRELDRLAAEAVALTHGHPIAFLSGAVLEHMISLLVREPELEMTLMVQRAMDAVQEQFGREYPQTAEIAELLRLAVSLAKSEQATQWEAMALLGCETCAEILAGAVYACLVSGEDFDTAMIVSVNHSGRSAAVGAVTGALLGARLGEETLPDFYLECLESVPILRELADDLIQGCPMAWTHNLFDDDWDQKYVQGMPVERGEELDETPFW